MSGSIQSIVATPLHVVAESNIALAHLNFDFSLAKFEAPLELQPLGKQLSKARRESAEDGSFHILARRLGVLFDDVLPEVPALLEAYGTRASEIVQETTPKFDKSKNICDKWKVGASNSSSDLYFGSYLVPQEATAIWAELVSQRQKIIKRQAQSAEVADNYLAQLAAAHEIDRSSLGSWDASARAWLQVADQARRKEQVQAQLIVNNLSMAVKSHTESDQTFASKTNSYDSVLLNVNRALTTLDKLIKGEPQRITDGGILLGLISWHIFPDLVVLGSSTKEIHQQDPLVKAGGIVTISISTQINRGDGVYWSLPLASLRYYGTVQRERSSMRDSRISVPQLQALLLGASLGADEFAFTAAQILLSLWKIYHNAFQARMYQVTNKTFEPSEDLPLLHRVEILQDAPQSLRALMKILHLIFPFKDGIDLLLSADDCERKMAHQLMRYGSNYGSSWIGNTKSSTSTLFGLANLSSLLRMITVPAARINLLRDLCKEYLLSPSDYVIRFRSAKNMWAYASIANEQFENLHGGTKRKWDEYESQETDTFKHLDIPQGENWVFIATLEASRGHAQESFYSDFHEDFFTEFLEENPGVVKLLSLILLSEITTLQPMVQNLLDKNLLRLDTVAMYLSHHFETDQQVHGNSLLALGRVFDYYKCHLPEATVSMGVIKNPLNSWKWSQSVTDELDMLSTLANQQARMGNLPVSIYPSVLSRKSAFAAILQFESGTIDVDPSDLIAVLAISSGNSLFIAEELLHDPTPLADVSPCAISQVMGNVGKPGIALLVPPPELQIRQHDLERWHFVNHNPFDGNLTGGMFEGTSLHMSFTGWEGPVSLGPSSYRGMDAYFVETIVSVNDGGEWVGDLDILKGLKDLKMEKINSAVIECSHDPSFAAAGVKMVSIDCWEEILDPPSGFLVLRSTPGTHDGRGQWQWMIFAYLLVI
ncbi:hypothetical protein N7513_005011 [Penicillium frequentans]|nr:hypothetical protein N7513_005011 [Penicillium glabrum]